MSIKAHGKPVKPKYWTAPFLGQLMFLLLLWMGNFFTEIKLPQMLVLSALALAFVFSWWELARGYKRKVNAYIRIVSGVVWQGVLFWGGFYSVFN